SNQLRNDRRFSLLQEIFEDNLVEIVTYLYDEGYIDLQEMEGSENLEVVETAWLVPGDIQLLEIDMNVLNRLLENAGGANFLKNPSRYTAKTKEEAIEKANELFENGSF
ncbi:MAG: hypothetical protein AAFW73_14625, partial [Bacteroidota bacterium]